MRVMVIYRGLTDRPMNAAYAAECDRFNQELVAAGLVVAGEPLMPSRHAKRVRFRPRKTIVLDGPFAETREIVAGYSIWRVESMEEALDWLTRHPMPPDFEQAEMDVYPLYEWPDHRPE